MFYVEHGIALHAVQKNRASSRGEGQVSWFFLSCGGNLGYIFQLRLAWPSKTRVYSATSELLSSCEGHLGILFEAWQGSRDASQGETETQGPFPVAAWVLGFLSIFKRSQVSSPFEALNSVCLSRCQRDVRPPVEMSGELGLSLGNPWVFRHPFTLEDAGQACIQVTAGKSGLISSQGISVSIPHIAANSGSLSLVPKTERSLLLRCLWKVDTALESKPGNQLSSQVDLGYTELFLVAAVISGSL